MKENESNRDKMKDNAKRIVDDGYIKTTQKPPRIEDETKNNGMNISLWKKRRDKTRKRED